MTIDNIISGLIYLICGYILFYAGKLIFQLLHPKYRLNEELFQRDNLAMAVVIIGYYLGTVLAIGGAIVGPSRGLIWDIIDIFLYGALAIVLMNVSTYINDWIILYRFKVFKEIIEDKNAGTGAVAAAGYIATGLIIYGALSGHGGTILASVVFWAFGQVILAVAGIVYSVFSPYKIHEEIERDNVAAGVAFAGALVGIGNILRVAANVDFTSWTSSVTVLSIYSLIGLVLLPIIRWVTDWILVPGETLSHEIAGQEQPNLGAGFIEAFSYIGASFLIGWSL